MPGIAKVLEKAESGIPSWACMICKKAGKSLEDCLRHYKFGDSSNMLKHLNNTLDHKKAVDDLEKKKAKKKVSLV
jgi:hypothetical protein